MFFQKIRAFFEWLSAKRMKQSRKALDYPWTTHQSVHRPAEKGLEEKPETSQTLRAEKPAAKVQSEVQTAASVAETQKRKPSEASAKAAVGGEESGHLVLGDYSKTGDALVVGLFLSLALVNSKKKMSELFPVFSLEPVAAFNLRFADNAVVKKIMADEQVLKAADAASQKVAACGRVVFRASGTEPVVRIWVGGKDETLVNEAAADIKKAVEQAA